MAAGARRSRPQPAAPFGYPPSTPGSGETNGLAIGSLILGILWLVGLGSLLAVIFGHVALAQNKKTHRSGNGLATSGLILGYLGLAGAVALVLLGAGASNAHSTASYQASMLSDLRTVAQNVEAENVDAEDYTQTTFANGRATDGATVTGSGQTVGADRVVLSPGNTITWVGATNVAFCLKATSTHTSATWYYDSANGGLTQVPCSAVNP